MAQFKKMSEEDNSLDTLRDELVLHLKNHDLDGVEITVEDAEQALSFIHQGYPRMEAIDRVLTGIYNVLSLEN